MQDTRVSSGLCELICDWADENYVMEIVRGVVSFTDGIFRRRETKGRNPSVFAGYKKSSAFQILGQ